MAQNGVGVNATVHFESKELLPIIVTTVSFKGLSSEDLRKSLLFSPKDKEKEIIQNIIGLSDKSSDLRDYSIENVGFTNYANGKALAVTATVQAPNLLEKAGPKYLFRAGELIGKQAELYDEEKRKLPVEIEYPNEQPRKLVIDIPAGYKVMNPEVFRVNVGCKIDGREVSGLHSDYQLLGQQLSVTVREFYERTSYPLSKYEDYRKVINAAADFNKIVLVLQKI
jgi:hypothetical protein